MSSKQRQNNASTGSKSAGARPMIDSDGVLGQSITQRESFCTYASVVKGSSTANGPLSFSEAQDLVLMSLHKKMEDHPEWNAERRIMESREAFQYLRYLEEEFMRANSALEFSTPITDPVTPSPSESTPAKSQDFVARCRSRASSASSKDVISSPSTPTSQRGSDYFSPEESVDRCSPSPKDSESKPDSRGSLLETRDDARTTNLSTNKECSSNGTVTSADEPAPSSTPEPENDDSNRKLGWVTQANSKALTIRLSSAATAFLTKISPQTEGFVKKFKRFPSVSVIARGFRDSEITAATDLSTVAPLGSTILFTTAEFSVTPLGAYVSLDGVTVRSRPPVHSAFAYVTEASLLGINYSNKESMVARAVLGVIEFPYHLDDFKDAEILLSVKHFDHSTNYVHDIREGDIVLVKAYEIPPQVSSSTYHVITVDLVPNSLLARYRSLCDVATSGENPAKFIRNNLRIQVACLVAEARQRATSIEVSGEHHSVEVSIARSNLPNATRNHAILTAVLPTLSSYSTLERVELRNTKLPSRRIRAYISDVSDQRNRGVLKIIPLQLEDNILLLTLSTVLSSGEWSIKSTPDYSSLATLIGEIRGLATKLVYPQSVLYTILLKLFRYSPEDPEERAPPESLSGIRGTLKISENNKFTPTSEQDLFGARVLRSAGISLIPLLAAAGTGKTCAISQTCHKILEQALLEGTTARILVTCQTNVAVAAAAESLYSLSTITDQINVLKVIAPHREPLEPDHSARYCLHSLNRQPNVDPTADFGRLVELREKIVDLEGQLESVNDNIRELIAANNERIVNSREFRHLSDLLHQIQSEKDSLEAKIPLVMLELTNPNVICCTLAVAHDLRLSGVKFSHVVVDEAAYASEVMTVLAASKLSEYPDEGDPNEWSAPLIYQTPTCDQRQLILVGDPRQLLPSCNLKGQGRQFVCQTSFSQFASLYPYTLSRLTENFRNPRMIVELLGDAFYANDISTRADYNTRSLRELNKAFGKMLLNPDAPIIFDNIPEGQEVKDASGSFSNEQEAAAACEYALQLEHSFASLQHHKKTIIIVSYKAQKRLIENIFARSKIRFPSENIQTIDAAQGSEAEVVILSLVRSNPDATVGFLRSPNRLCVALSRAKKMLIVIGNHSMLIHNPNFKRAIEFADKNKFIYTRHHLQFVNPVLRNKILGIRASQTKDPYSMDSSSQLLEELQL
jgi:hypothetical protein